MVNRSSVGPWVCSFFLLVEINFNFHFLSMDSFAFSFLFLYLPPWGIFCFKFHVFAKETIFFIDFAIVFSFVVVFFLQIEVLNLATFLLLNLVKCLVVDLYSVLIISLKSSVMRKRGKNCCYRHTDK